MDSSSAWRVGLILSAICVYYHAEALTYGSSEVTYPERLSEHRNKRDLSTATQNGHEDEASFSIDAFKRNMILDTKLNKKLLHPSFTVRTYDKDDSEILSQDVPDHCHYQGSLRGEPDSMVVLHTCNGLRGIIDDGKNTYHIEPHDDPEKSGAHKIYSVEEDSMDHGKCGVSGHDHDDEPYTGMSKINSLVSRLRRSTGVSDVEDIYRPYLTTDETRYNELVFVVDNIVYQRYQNNTKTVTEKVIILCNAVDAIYQRINIRLSMKAIDIWTNGDRIERQASGGGELGKFREYRSKYITPKISHDNAQFISYKGWIDGVIGMAWVTSMCGGNSAGVNAWSFGSVIGPYVVVAHEMGHNFGMGHDSGSCKCLTPKGCIMGGHKTRVPGFSNCSMAGLRNINDRCLYNVPTEALNARCGNGIREGGEECDCGTPEMCKAKDKCCEPHGCRLKASALCSDLHHSCCQDCQYKKQGILCRATKTDCDIPEYCPGDTRDCPTNSFVQDGVACNRTQKLIQANTNRGSVVKKHLNPKIQARYLRINPQYWYGWPCLRTELYGCQADEDKPAAPTGIKAYNDYCVVPKNATCDPHDGSRVVFTWGYQCKDNYMQWSLDSAGILRHQCSGRKVCPEGGNTGNGARLVISDACKDEDAKFIRTAEKTLKHVKSGKCVHPYGAWPGEGRELVLWSGCTHYRLQFWFMKNDCIQPLGVRSGAISNKQMTATSSRPADKPYMGRLHNKKFWCAAAKNKNEYLQIDLGAEKTISSLDVQGRGNWYDWIQAFFLYYSDDGQRWTPYTERGLHSNSNCYLGKCAETPATQCRDLWGSKANNAAKACYDKLNIEAQGYGTCDAAKNTSCTAENVMCGQIQCANDGSTPVVKYGKSYEKFTLTGGETCSGAVLSSSDTLGRGMVADGTKCGDNKMCVKAECKAYADLGIGSCPLVDGQECAGRGICTNEKVCFCDAGYDPKTACKTTLTPRDGGFGAWAEWSECSRGCDGGKRTRHRFCNNPFPAHGGQDCVGDLQQEEVCQAQSCPVARSCRHLQQIATEFKLSLGDGVYKIYPQGQSNPIMTYCDMTRDGGGWTLLVTSHTNTWTADNVKLRNAGAPSLENDFSILKHADSIKDNINIVGETFEYRLEAQSRGRWGGIWRAGRSYTFTATNNGQTNVQLVKKFDNWNYHNNAIEKRMPWISGARLTTSQNPRSGWWGTITGDEKGYHPAPWISGHLMESQPEHIWYWMKEGPMVLPRSCMEVQMRGLQTTPVSNGIFTIKPPGSIEVKTYCDVTSHGGGWTLVATSKTHSGWSADNVKHRNPDTPSLDADYSILGYADAIKDFDNSQDFFQYRIEADGDNKYGGIWNAPQSYTFTSNCDKQTDVKLVKSFDNLPADSNLAKLMPRLELSPADNPDILLTSATSVDDSSGSLIYNGNSASYLPGVKEKPGVVRYWMREGTRRSCNDIKLHGVRSGRKYEDGYYMISLLGPSQYLPVYCDMTSEPGAFTLLVTSRHNNWTRAQVPARNVFSPSLSGDYSILKYGNMIKNLGKNDTFEYKLEANQRGHWGGVWTAPQSYSFMATHAGQTSVTLVRKFDNWGFSWWNGLNNRMPWFYKNGNAKKALLTTSSSPTYYPSGSILWGDTQYRPAYWVTYGGMTNPGTIWYWVNEDDCDSNRQPVHAGLSAWSEWDKCDKLCANGTQKRVRYCTNPKPRCGGNDCRALGDTVETRPCYSCDESPIRSYGGYCIQPQNASCTPADNNRLIFKKADAECSKPYMNFVIDVDGVIHHKCSGKIVCPDGNWPGQGHKLVLKTTCPLDISKFRRLASKSLQITKNNKCVHPNGGWPGENRNLVLWDGCNDNRLNLDFFKLAPPA